MNSLIIADLILYIPVLMITAQIPFSDDLYHLNLFKKILIGFVCFTPLNVVLLIFMEIWTGWDSFLNYRIEQKEK